MGKETEEDVELEKVEEENDKIKLELPPEKNIVMKPRKRNPKTLETKHDLFVSQISFISG